MKNTKISARSMTLVFTALLLAGCAQTREPLVVSPSKISGQAPAVVENEDLNLEAEPTQNTTSLTRLRAANRPNTQLSGGQQLALNFTDSDSQTVMANELPLKEFVQSVLGETLKLNYIITDPSKNAVPINLNLQQPVSSRRLFTLTEQLLKQQGLTLVERDAVYYIHPISSDRQDAVVIGFGRRMQDIPDSTGEILQIMPLKYGVSASIERTLNGLSNARIRPESQQSALFVQGPRAEIMRVADLLSLLDMPSNRGKYIGLMELTYIAPKAFTEKLADLLAAEGIPLSSNTASGSAVLAVVIEQIGAVALFASSDDLLNRAEYWAKIIDRPEKGAQAKYFIFHPRYARAADLGQSLAPLIGGQAPLQGNRNRDTQTAQNSENAATARSDGGATSFSVTGSDTRMTVDERSNTLVFFTQGETYQSLLPIIRRLDILPKQILIDATIAEVTLTDEFAQGFEFAFRSGRLTGGTLGAFGVTDMGGFNLNWGDGVSRILARLSEKTSLVNILSNPTLVVRDGVSATINVGNDIPTVGSTTINPGTETQSTTVVYRKTGVKLTVTPTINAQGLVVLEIDQQISNTSDSGPQLAGSPSVFERSIQTEVIAQSGQTILLGGLISEDNSSGSSGIPGLSTIPVFGQLFKGENRKKSKTELVIFITPQVIDNVDQWQAIRNSVAKGLTNITISD